MNPAPAKIDELLQRFTAAVFDTFGLPNVACVLVHGSLARGGFIPGFSDADLMVFLRPVCFVRGETVFDALAFTFQERAGALPWRDIGVAYPQVYFRDVEHFENWWTIPGGHRILHGELPGRARGSNELVREHARDLLTRRLPEVIDREVRDFAEAPDELLPRRLRMLGTSINPVLFALVACDEAEALALWAETKEQALGRLRLRHPEAPGPDNVERFYRDVRYLFMPRNWDIEAARDAFRTGVAFLRWAEGIAADEGLSA